MNDKLQRDTLICPCCGSNREIESPECSSCGAKQVGPPLAPPDVVMPKLGPSFGALACGLLVIFVFLAVWVLGNDMRVGRVFLVWAVGDGTEFTRNLLQVEPKLPYYRIFSFDAYRLAFTLAIGAIPVSILGMWLARRAARLIRFDSSRFGGMKIARVSFAFSLSLFVIFSAVTISSIPRAIETGRAKRVAATRALMYELHAQALQKYYREYGTYPQELADLSRVNADAAPQADYWKQNFVYQPVGVIASRGSAISLSNYKLVSAGRDGKFGTKDDITMVDGLIVDSQNETDALEGLPQLSPRQ